MKNYYQFFNGVVIKYEPVLSTNKGTIYSSKFINVLYTFEELKEREEKEKKNFLKKIIKIIKSKKN